MSTRSLVGPGRGIRQDRRAPQMRDGSRPHINLTKRERMDTYLIVGLIALAMVLLAQVVY